MIIFYTVVKVYGFPPGCFWGILQELSHPIHNCYSCGTELQNPLVKNLLLGTMINQNTLMKNMK